MSLDRNAVDKGAGEHIRQLEAKRHVPAEEKDAIRKQHEQIAAKVAATHPRKSSTVAPPPKPVKREIGRFRIR